MSFLFRFERVLSVRRVQEVAAHGAWQAAMSHVRRHEEDLRSVRAQLVEQREELATRQTNGGLPAAQILAAYAGLDRTEARARRLREELVTLSEQAERLREPWQERRLERMSLERLREREKTSWDAEQKLMHSREMDEIASVRSDSNRRAARESG